jgi:hypothetical protein
MHRHFETALILIIDFDGHTDNDDRRKVFEDAMRAALRNRVFVIGAKTEAENAKKSAKLTYEKLGLALAEECAYGQGDLWSIDELAHNADEIARMKSEADPAIRNTIQFHT